MLPNFLPLAERFLHSLIISVNFNSSMSNIIDILWIESETWGNYLYQLKGKIFESYRFSGRIGRRTLKT